MDNDSVSTLKDDVDVALDDTYPLHITTSAATFPIPASLLIPTRINHFIILDKLGEGGMGVVYSAYDPKLNRKVAIKLLRPVQQEHDHARSRLLREAQSMARLSHPNVAHIYEVGEFNQQIYIVIEHIEGKTLRDWLSSSSHTRKEILNICIQAGQGLDAAHRAGIAHRDFKPENILIDSNNRVCVIDFGLARFTRKFLQQPNTEQYHDDDDDHDHDHDDDDHDDDHHHPLTLAGTILGTPAYMSPEQYKGIQATAASDQFSFCVVLYEGLTGKRPFLGKSLRDIRRSILLGQVLSFPSSLQVPIHIRRAVRRGLSKNVEERFPSMAPLLRELRKDRFARIRRASVIVVLLAALATSAWALTHSRSSNDDPCKHAADRVQSVWNHKTKRTMRDAFIASDRAHATRSFERVNNVLDNYAKAWTTMRVNTCEATHIRKEQSAHLLDLRMQCLDRRLEQMSALVQVLSSQPSKDAIDNAITAAYQLPTFDVCQNATTLPHLLMSPHDPEQRKRHDALSQRLARALALQSTGSYLDGSELAENVLIKARELGHIPLVAEALHVAGDLATQTEESKGGEKLLLEATKLAATVGNDELSAKAWLTLLWTIGHDRARFEEASLAGHSAEVAILRMGNAPLMRASLYNHLGSVAWTAGKTDEALHMHKQAFELRRQNLGNHHPQVAESLKNIGAVMYRQGRFSESAAHYEQALAIYEGTLGEDHPDTSTSHLNMGVTLVSLGKLEQAHEHYLRALEILNSTHGEDHSDVGLVNYNLGEYWWLQRRYQRAYERFSRALNVFHKVHGSQHPFTAYALTGVGQALVGLKRPNEAIEVLESARRIRTNNTDEPTQQALTLFYLQRAFWQRGARDPQIIERARDAYDVYRTGENRLTAEAKLMDEWLALVARPAK